MVPGGVRNLIGILHLNELLMRPRIGTQQLPNHLLILRIVFLRLRLKEIHTLFAEGQCCAWHWRLEDTPSTDSLYYEPC